MRKILLLLLLFSVNVIAEDKKFRINNPDASLQSCYIKYSDRFYVFSLPPGEASDFYPLAGLTGWKCSVSRIKLAKINLYESPSEVVASL